MTSESNQQDCEGNGAQGAADGMKSAPETQKMFCLTRGKVEFVTFQLSIGREDDDIREWNYSKKKSSTYTSSS